MSTKPESEQQWAAIVVAELRTAGWEVYQEVPIPGGCVDIVAVRGCIRWAIEVKTSMNLAVMEQGRRNTPYFHYSSIAVPAPTKGQFTSSWNFASECGKVFGFGVLAIYPPSVRYGGPGKLVKKSEGCLNRRPLRVTLREQMQTEVGAGSNRGGQYTDFKHTVRQLESEARFKPGIALKEAVRAIQHHYSNEPSAVNCVSRYIRSGVISSLKLENGKLFLATAA